MRVNSGSLLLVPSRNRLAQDAAALGGGAGQLLIQFLQKGAVSFPDRKTHFLQLRRDLNAPACGLATCAGLGHNFLSTRPQQSYFIAMRLFSPALFLLIGSAMVAPASPNPGRHSRQCVVVEAPNWTSKTGFLRAFERTGPGRDWKARGPAIPVVLGKNGLAWGRGLVGAETGSEPRKIEGDNKAPAGIFRLGPAFGYAPARDATWIRLRYVPLTKQIEGIDDSRSRYYNQLVDRSRVARVDWHSSEKMLRADNLYKWGVFVAHNATAQSGAGSCIFLHIWKNSSAATAGCTAMAERDLVQLLKWLDPAAHPLLVQMPRGEYPAFQSKFGLPAVDRALPTR